MLDQPLIEVRKQQFMRSTKATKQESQSPCDYKPVRKNIPLGLRTRKKPANMEQSEFNPKHVNRQNKPNSTRVNKQSEFSPVKKSNQFSQKSKTRKEFLINKLVEEINSSQSQSPNEIYEKFLHELKFNLANDKNEEAINSYILLLIILRIIENDTYCPYKSEKKIKEDLTCLCADNNAGEIPLKLNKLLDSWNTISSSYLFI